MTALGLLCACVLAAYSGEGGDAPRDGVGAKRDLFGTVRRGPGTHAGSPSGAWGTVELSDGETAEGWISLAPGRTLEVYDLEREEWRDLGIREIATLSAVPRKEELEREWCWREYGKDEKVYTGRAYPRRWLDHVIMLRRPDGQEGEKGGERIRCHIRGVVLYLTPAGRTSKRCGPAPAGRTSKQRGPAPAGRTSKRCGPAPEPDETAAWSGQRRRPDDAPAEEKGSGEKRPGERGETEAKRDDREEEGDAKTRPEAPKRLRFVLRQYERGELGQTLGDLVYVKRVTVHEKSRVLKREAGKKQVQPEEAVRPASAPEE